MQAIKKERQPFGSWQRSSIDYSRGHFFEPESADEKRDLFSRSMQSVALEITAHCNRRCGYCPVSLVPRMHNKTTMSDEVMDRVLRDLAAIDYSRVVTLNLYNEPMSDRPFLLKTISRIRAKVQKAWISFSTNGDYLDREYLEEAVDAGLSELVISIHTAPTKTFNVTDSIGRMKELASKLGVGLDFSYVRDDDAAGTLTYDRIPITIFTRNFETKGVNRAGAMKNVEVARKRQSPCDRPFRTMTIDYEGNIFPCCMFYPDLPSSVAFRVGHILNYPTIFEAYASQSLADWRRALFSHGDKGAPCDSCLEADWCATEGERRKRSDLARSFDL